MPCRYIREEYLTSERVDLLDAKAERFYFRLFLVVDDFGRFEANERLLKSKVFPLKEDVRTTDISRWLAACETAGLIRLYTISGKRYLSVDKFTQTRSNCRSTKSKYPEPPIEADEVLQSMENLQVNEISKQKSIANAQSNNDAEKKTDDLLFGDEIFAIEQEDDLFTPLEDTPVPASEPAPESAFNSRGILTAYPQTVEEVLEISVRIRSPMDRELAQRYFDQRTRAEWHQGVGGTGRKIKPEHIPSDIRLWIDREKAQNAQQSKPPPGKNTRETRIALINGEMDEDYDALMPTYNPPALAGILADLEKEEKEGKEKG